MAGILTETTTLIDSELPQSPSSNGDSASNAIGSGTLTLAGLDAQDSSQTKQLRAFVTIQASGIKFSSAANGSNGSTFAEFIAGKLQGPISVTGNLTLSGLPAPLNQPLTVNYTQSDTTSFSITTAVTLFDQPLALTIAFGASTLSFSAPNGIVIAGVGLLKLTKLAAAVQGDKRLIAEWSITPALPAPLDQPFVALIDYKSERTKIALDYPGQLDIVAGNFSLSGLGLVWEKKGVKEWQVDGDVTAKLFDKEFKLKANYEQIGAERALSLSMDNDTMIKIGDLGEVKISKLALQIKQQATRREWSIATEGSLKVTALPDPLNRTFALGMGLDGGQIWLKASQQDSNDKLTIVENFSLSNIQLAFTRSSGAINVRGGVSATLFEHSFDLAASYEQKAGQASQPTERAFTLKYRSSDTLPISFDQVVTLDLTSCELAVTSAGQSRTWDLAAEGELAFPDVAAFSGTLELHRETNRDSRSSATSLAFTSDKEYTFDLPLQPGSADYVVVIGVTPRSLSIANEIVRPQAGLATKRWRFKSQAGLRISGIDLPTGIPTSYEVSLAADAIGVSISLDHVLDKAAVTLPSITVAGQSIDFGTLRLSMSDLSLSIGRAIAVGASLSAELPTELNNIFGSADGQPSHIFFAGSLDLKLAADTTSGVALTLEKLPIAEKVWHTRTEGSGPNKKIWQVLDLDEFGAVEFVLPTFSFKNGAFAASDEFMITRPLSLPLTPLKQLAAAYGLSAAADLLPDKLALDRIDLLKNGTLDVDGFMKLIEASDLDLPKDAFRTVLDAIADQVAYLPDDFKSYLSFVPPSQLAFDMAFSIDGGIRIDIRAEQEPLKFMLFAINPLPCLLGVTLKKLTTGEVLAGSLGLLGLDVTLDYFDLHALAGAVILPDAAREPLPDTTQLHRKIVIEDLLALVVYETIIPIPIPLFYNSIGLDYLGIEGLGLGMQWQFPMPEGGIFDLAGLLGDMKPFFTDPNYFLPVPEDAGYVAEKDDLFAKHHLALDFSVKPAYFQLPKYLGGKALGNPGATTIDAPFWSVSLTEMFAELINTVKQPRLGRFVRELPPAQRVGSESVAFGPLALHADWIISTDRELREAIEVNPARSSVFVDTLARSIPAADQHELLNLIRFDQGQPIADNDDGAIVLLLGEWSIDRVIDLRARLGLAQSATLGYGFGFGIKGDIADGFMQFAANGGLTVNVDNQQSPVLLDGRSSLAILDHEIFRGQIQLNGDGFDMDGQIALFPPESPLQVGGHGLASIHKDGQVHFHSDASVSLYNLALFNATIDIANDRVRLSGDLLGTHADFDLEVRGSSFLLQGDINLDYIFDMRIGPIHEPITGMRVIDKFTFGKTGLTATLHTELGTSGFMAKVASSFTWNGKTFNVPEFTLYVAPRDAHALLGMIVDEIEAHADEIFAQVFGSVSDWIKAGVDNLVKLGRKLDQIAQVAVGWVEGAWANVATWSEGAWQATAWWSRQAWESTKRWSVAAWQATTKWSASAWTATTQWSDAAWHATTQWSDTAWSATTQWSSTAWQATTEWTEDAWNDTIEWTEDQWNTSVKTITTGIGQVVDDINQAVRFGEQTIGQIANGIDTVVDGIKGVVDSISGAFGGVNNIGDKFTGVTDDVGQKFKDFGKDVEDKFKDVGNKLADIFGKL